MTTFIVTPQPSNLTDEILHHQITVDVALELTQTPKNIFNHFDHMGNLLSLKRIEGERNRSFKERLLDVYANRGGSNYDGLINGITRNLDIDRYDALTIQQVPNVSFGPRIDLQADRLILWRFWNGVNDAEIEMEIPFYNRTDEGYYLSQLIDIVNDPITGSKLYTIEPFDGVDLHVPTRTLRRTNSISFVGEQNLLKTNVQFLGNTYLVPNTIAVKSRTLKREITFSPETDISTEPKGTYMIDFANGFLHISGGPGRGDTISYSYRKFPLVLQGTNISINSFRDEDFRSQLFNKTETDVGTLIEGLPNAEGLDIIEELFQVSKIYWGN